MLGGNLIVLILANGEMDCSCWSDINKMNSTCAQRKHFLLRTTKSLTFTPFFPKKNISLSEISEKSKTSKTNVKQLKSFHNASW